MVAVPVLWRPPSPAEPETRAEPALEAPEGSPSSCVHGGARRALGSGPGCVSGAAASVQVERAQALLCALLQLLGTR